VLRVYASHWLVNATGLDLSLQTQSKVLFSSAEFPLPDAGTPTPTPVIYTPPSVGLTKNKTRIKVAGAKDWCSGFELTEGMHELEIPGSQRGAGNTIAAPSSGGSSSNDNARLAVNIYPASGDFMRTTVVEISAKMVLVNRTAAWGRVYPYGFENGPGAVLNAEPGARTSFHFGPDGSGKRFVIVELESPQGVLVSPPLDVAVPGKIACGMRLKGEAAALPAMYLAIDVLPRDLNLFVVLERTTQDELPFVVDNDTGFVVRVRQVAWRGGS
jgi:hypothetical protein